MLAFLQDRIICQCCSIGRGQFVTLQTKKDAIDKHAICKSHEDNFKLHKGKVFDCENGAPVVPGVVAIEELHAKELGRKKLPLLKNVFYLLKNDRPLSE